MRRSSLCKSMNEPMKPVQLFRAYVGAHTSFPFWSSSGSQASRLTYFGDEPHLCILLQNVTDGSHENIDLLPALVVASLYPPCVLTYARKEARRKASLHPKTTRLLHWLCSACILADGYPDFCTSRRLSVDPLYLSFPITVSTSKEAMTAKGDKHHGILHDSRRLHR